MSAWTALATYPDIPQHDWWRRQWTALIITTIHFFWAGLKFYTAVGKLVEFDDLDFVRHYTNWSWVLQTVLYISTIAIALVQVGVLRHDGAYSKFAQFVIAMLYFPIIGIVITVRVLVWVLLGTNSPFLQKFFEVMSPSFVMLGDDAFHFMPVLEILIFTLIYRKFIAVSFNWLIGHTRMLDSPARYTLFILYNAYGFLTFTIIIYRRLFDPHIVYLTDVADIYGLAVVYLTLTVFVLLPLLFFFWLLGVASHKLYTVEFLHRNDADPYVIGYYEYSEKGK